MSSIVKIAKIAPSASIVYQFLVFFLKLSTVIGARGRPMEPAANPVEEAPKPDPGGTTRPYKQALAFQVHL